MKQVERIFEWIPPKRNNWIFEQYLIRKGELSLAGAVNRLMQFFLWLFYLSCITQGKRLSLTVLVFCWQFRHNTRNHEHNKKRDQNLHNEHFHLKNKWARGNLYLYQHGNTRTRLWQTTKEKWCKFTLLKIYLWQENFTSWIDCPITR